MKSLRTILLVGALALGPIACRASDDEKAFEAVSLPKLTADEVNVGDRVRVMGGMGCFRFSANEYRCVKLTARRAAVVSARAISGVPSGYMDANCPTASRGIREPECGFDLVFTLRGIGTDHMETTRFYAADQIELLPSTR